MKTYSHSDVTGVGILKGKIMKRVFWDTEHGEEYIKFIDIDGNRYMLFHCQNCYERVYIKDIVGDLSDLVGVPILMAEEVSSKDEDPPNFVNTDRDRESFTWTFYKFATIKGHVTISWYGESNGYYSEGVDFGGCDSNWKVFD